MLLHTYLWLIGASKSLLNLVDMHLQKGDCKKTDIRYLFSEQKCDYWSPTTRANSDNCHLGAAPFSAQLSINFLPPKPNKDFGLEFYFERPGWDFCTFSSYLIFSGRNVVELCTQLKLLHLPPLPLYPSVSLPSLPTPAPLSPFPTFPCFRMKTKQRSTWWEEIGWKLERVDFHHLPQKVSLWWAH